MPVKETFQGGRSFKSQFKLNCLFNLLQTCFKSGFP